MNSAIIDLGTNTFRMIIFDHETVIFEDSLAPKMGEKGINKNIITTEALQRGIEVLRTFNTYLEEYKVPQNRVFAFGTSALRNAENQQEVLERFKQETGIVVKVISGTEEAQLIYEGVKNAVDIQENSLIIDIGGGSTEFILCNNKKILWMQSFEIGGQRLVERFMKTDPFPLWEIERLESYFRESLLPLANAIHQYKPTQLIGSSGSFDTLNAMYFYQKNQLPPPLNQVGFDYPLEAFGQAIEQLLLNNREQRLQIPGMIELRVDTIVMAGLLINYLLKTYEIKKIKISNYSLREGAMFHAQ